MKIWVGGKKAKRKGKAMSDEWWDGHGTNTSYVGSCKHEGDLVFEHPYPVYASSFGKGAFQKENTLIVDLAKSFGQVIKFYGVKDDPFVEMNYPLVDINWGDFKAGPINKDGWKILIPGLWKACEDLGYEGITVGCHGGHGRTGTFLTIWGSLTGQIPVAADPVAWLRKKYCDHAVESEAQIAYVEKITGRKVKSAAYKATTSGYGTNSAVKPWCNHSLQSTAENTTKGTVCETSNHLCKHRDPHDGNHECTRNTCKASWTSAESYRTSYGGTAGFKPTTPGVVVSAAVVHTPQTSAIDRVSCPACFTLYHPQGICPKCPPKVPYGQGTHYGSGVARVSPTGAVATPPGWASSDV